MKQAISFFEALGKRKSFLTMKWPKARDMNNEKFIWHSPEQTNPVTGKPIATYLGDLSPLKEGEVYAVHRTSSHEAIEGILHEGLRGKYGISGTTTKHNLEDLWNMLENEEHMQYGRNYVIMKMPSREYNKLAFTDGYYKKGSIEDLSGYNNARNLYVHPQYVVGVINRWFAKGDLPHKMFEKMKAESLAHKPLDIKPVDLRHLNPGRPRKLDLTDPWAVESTIPKYNVTWYDKKGNYIGPKNKTIEPAHQVVSDETTQIENIENQKTDNLDWDFDAWA